MDTKRILKEIGLTDAGLRDYLKKLSAFYDSLDTHQQEVFNRSMRSSEHEALTTFGGNVTATQLEAFIKSREPKGQKMVCIIRACYHDPDAK